MKAGYSIILSHVHRRFVSKIDVQWVTCSPLQWYIWVIRVHRFYIELCEISVQNPKTYSTNLVGSLGNEFM